MGGRYEGAVLVGEEGEFESEEGEEGVETPLECLIVSTNKHIVFFF